MSVLLTVPLCRDAVPVVAHATVGACAKALKDAGVHQPPYDPHRAVVDDNREISEVNTREASAGWCGCAPVPVGALAAAGSGYGTGGCPSRDPITAYGNDFGRGLQRVEQLGDRVSHLSRERALLFLELRDELPVAGEDLPPEGSTGTGQERVKS